MKRIEIKDSKNVVLILQDEIRRNSESRYNHRLHAVLLVAQGMSCRQVANKLGDGARTVAYWLRRFEEEGLSGLADGEKLGRPKRLNESQLEKSRDSTKGVSRGSRDGCQPMGRQGTVCIYEARMGNKSRYSSMPAVISSIGISAS